MDSGETVFDMTGGEQLRDYLSVTEVARRIVCLALGQKDAGIVNICSGTPVSVRYLVERWSQEFGWDLIFNFGKLEYSDYEPMAFWGDTQKYEHICLYSST